MERKANYALVGLSTLILFIGMVVFVVWLARLSFNREYELFDILFVWHFHMGARGVGLGTACAEWTALATGLLLVAPHLKPRVKLFHKAAVTRLLAVNADIMIRTIALLTLFTWLANAGARLGAVSLAANQVLLQAVGLVAFVLDGFAFTAESRVGLAIGARDALALRRAIRLTGEFSFGFAAIACLIIWIGGEVGVRFLAADPGVRDTAIMLIPAVALLPLIGTPAWLLDGIFIGATGGRALRNAAILATALYIATDWAMRPWGIWGVWIAFSLSYVYRAATLGAYLPKLLRDFGPDPKAPASQGVA